MLSNYEFVSGSLSLTIDLVQDYWLGKERDMYVVDVYVDGLMSYDPTRAAKVTTKDLIGALRYLKSVVADAPVQSLFVCEPFGNAEANGIEQEEYNTQRIRWMYKAGFIWQPEFYMIWKLK